MSHSSFPQSAPKASTAAPRRSSQLRMGSYIADVLVDPKDSRLYHWAVRRVDSASILYIGSEKDFEGAERRAKEYLKSLDSAR